MRDHDLDFTIARLGECRIQSPMSGVRFTRDEERVLYHATLEGIRTCLDNGAAPPSMESAGPREQLFFDPAKLACGIVTCGGLCPGLNNVIRAVVLSLRHHYGVNKVYGFRFGYEGLVRRMGHPPLELTPQSVHRIHESGGSVLGSSRGPQDAAEMVDYLEELGVGILFAIGGDGTLRGAQTIGEEAARRGLKISVIGVPKTIDNDISFVQRTFGFETAVTEARRATDAANAEAEAARNGIGLVKLMGRDSGFIAAYSALVNNHVNFCLVPEVPFTSRGLAVGASAAARAPQPRGDRGRGRRRPGSDGEEPGARRVGERQVRRHRRLSTRRDQRATSSGPARRSLSNTSIPATPSGACRRPRPTRPSACSSDTARCTRASAGARTWSSASGITSSPTCRSPSPYPSARRSIRRAHSGTVWSHRPVSRGTCDEGVGARAISGRRFEHLK